MDVVIITRRRQWHLTPVLSPGKSHGRRSLEGCSPWGHWGLDTTEGLQFHFSLSCIGEGNGNPLQCSCLENPRDRGAWCPSLGSHRVGHDWSDVAAAAPRSYQYQFGLRNSLSRADLKQRSTCWTDIAQTKKVSQGWFSISLLRNIKSWLHFHTQFYKVQVKGNVGRPSVCLFGHHNHLPKR